MKGPIYVRIVAVNGMVDEDEPSCDGREERLLRYLGANPLEATA